MSKATQNLIISNEKKNEVRYFYRINKMNKEFMMILLDIYFNCKQNICVCVCKFGYS